MAAPLQPTSVFTTLFGDTLVTRHGKSVSTTHALQRKRVVGIFFTASVCERCRVFTPALATVYRNMQLKMYQDLAMRHELEIVMVSLDANASAFRDYRLQTPFLAMPLCERQRAHALLQRYDVQRMPSVVFVDEAAHAIERNGRALVDNHFLDLRGIWTALSSHRRSTQSTS